MGKKHAFPSATLSIVDSYNGAVEVREKPVAGVTPVEYGFGLGELHGQGRPYEGGGVERFQLEGDEGVNRGRGS